MNPTRLAAIAAAALGFTVLAACQDVPILPRWNADEKIPVSAQKITISPPFPAGITVPNGTSQSVSFPPQSQVIDGPLAQILKPGLVAGSIVTVVTKSATLGVSGADTLFIAQTVADLSSPLANRIVVPITIVAANAQDSAQTTIGSVPLSLFQTVANSTNDTLWVQMRGTATCAKAAGCVFTSGDSVAVRLTLLATVQISR